MSVTILDSTGATQTVNTLPALGQSNKAGSLPVALASDDPVVAATGTTADAAWASGSGTLIALLKTVATAALDTTTPSPVSPYSTAYSLNPAAQTPYRLRTSAASTNAALIKSSAGAVKWIIGKNNRSSVVYLELYNKSSAAPTVGTDTPYLSFELPANSAFAFDVAASGVKFGTGIGIGLHTVNADNDSTAVASGDITGLNVVFD